MNPVEAFLLGMLATFAALACLVAWCCVRIGARAELPTPPRQQPHVVDCHDGCRLAAETLAIRNLPERAS